MQITIEGVVSSDVIKQGDRRTVEVTPYIRQLLRYRLVRQIPFDSPELAAAKLAVETAEAEYAAAAEAEHQAAAEYAVSVAEEPAKPKRARRRRTDSESAEE